MKEIFSRSIEATEFSWISTKLSKKLCDKSSDAPRTPEASCDQETTASVPFVDLLWSINYRFIAYESICSSLWSNNNIQNVMQNTIENQILQI